jgi:hypothetical protein
MSGDLFIAFIIGILLAYLGFWILKPTMTFFMETLFYKKIELAGSKEWFKQIPEEDLYFWMLHDRYIETDYNDVKFWEQRNMKEKTWKHPDQHFLDVICPRGLDQMSLSCDCHFRGYPIAFKNYVTQINDFLTKCNRVKQERLRCLCLNLKNDIKVRNQNEFIYWTLVISFIIRPYPVVIKRYSSLYKSFVHNHPELSQYFPLTLKL